MKDWKIIGSSRTGLDLEVTKGMLVEKFGINAVLMNKKVSAYDLGNWELLVHENDLARVQEILENQNK